MHSTLSFAVGISLAYLVHALLALAAVMAGHVHSRAKPGFCTFCDYLVVVVLLSISVLHFLASGVSSIPFSTA